MSHQSKERGLRGFGEYPTVTGVGAVVVTGFIRIYISRRRSLKTSEYKIIRQLVRTRVCKYDENVLWAKCVKELRFQIKAPKRN